MKFIISLTCIVYFFSIIDPILNRNRRRDTPNKVHMSKFEYFELEAESKLISQVGSCTESGCRRRGSFLLKKVYDMALIIKKQLLNKKAKLYINTITADYNKNGVTTWSMSLQEEKGLKGGALLFRYDDLIKINYIRICAPSDASHPLFTTFDCPTELCMQTEKLTQDACRNTVNPAHAKDVIKGKGIVI